MKPDDKKETEEESKGSAKQLKLSEVVYGLGKSASAALTTFLIGTAALFFPIYFGQGKGGLVDKVTKIPDAIHNRWNKVFGEKSGKAGKALLLSASVATLFSYVAHVTGYFSGIKEIKAAEENYNDQVEDNQRLAREVKSLKETVARQGQDLTDARRQDSSFTKRLDAKASENNAGVSLGA